MTYRQAIVIQILDWYPAIANMSANEAPINPFIPLSYHLKARMAKGIPIANRYEPLGYDIKHATMGDADIIAPTMQDIVYDLISNVSTMRIAETTRINIVNKPAINPDPHSETNGEQMDWNHLVEDKKYSLFHRTLISSWLANSFVRINICVISPTTKAENPAYNDCLLKREKCFFIDLSIVCTIFP